MTQTGIWTRDTIAETIRKSYDLLSQSDKVRIEEMCIKLLRKELQLTLAARRQAKSND